MQYAINTLTIHGYRDALVPNTCIRQKNETQHLGIILPGIRYTAEMPLLYYPANLLLTMGADVLLVQYAYDRQPTFQTLEQEARARWLFTDATASYQAALSQRHYTRLTLIGKSLGTLSMGHLLTTETVPSQIDAIWLTPLIRLDSVRQHIQQFGQPSLFVIGTKDPHYDSGHLQEIEQGTGSEIVTIEGGDHSLNIEHDVLKSIEALQTIMIAIEKFLQRGDM